MDSVNSKMEEMSGMIDEVRIQAFQNEVNISEEYLEQEVQNTIRNLYQDKIEQIERN